VTTHRTLSFEPRPAAPVSIARDLDRAVEGESARAEWAFTCQAPE